MFNTSEFIDEIIKKLDVLADSKGIARAALIIEITQMLTTLKDGVEKQRIAYEVDKKTLTEKLEQALIKEVENNGY